MAAFFCQAEDGIRDTSVTGVQTCALPILTLTVPGVWAGVFAVIFVELTTTTLVAAEPPNVTVAPLWKPVPLIVTFLPPDDFRSEERRVGTEGRSGCAGGSDMTISVDSCVS